MALAGKRSSPQEPGDFRRGTMSTTGRETIREPKTGHRTSPALLLLPTSPGVITGQFNLLSQPVDWLEPGLSGNNWFELELTVIKFKSTSVRLKDELGLNFVAESKDSEVISGLKQAGEEEEEANHSKSAGKDNLLSGMFKKAFLTMGQHSKEGLTRKTKPFKMQSKIHGFTNKMV
ncbi:hypothetical protein DSO57_1032810 [Entomophthora muscae]|uniref:Uncharacterized protein n=1 Tax=Entomophthora muscae TaxID=34485 RepID=A0ACC2TYY6_9FUNG|nr:hypothetical protein DSO57_1032810 [Entomophthora muscae]